jgi:hypothetical protein
MESHQRKRGSCRKRVSTSSDSRNQNGGEQHCSVLRDRFTLHSGPKVTGVIKLQFSSTVNTPFHGASFLTLQRGIHHHFTASANPAKFRFSWDQAFIVN